MLLQDVCPSDRLSVTRRYSVETVTQILKRFTLSASHTILVSAHETVRQYSDGDHSNAGVVECRG